MEYKELDPSVIVSGVCQKCADCCRGRFYLPAPNKDQENFHRAIFGNMPHVALNENTEELGGRKVLRGNMRCSMLIEHKSSKTFACGIYETRPNICRDFNCFDKSNQEKKHPRNLEKIQRLVHEHFGPDRSVFKK